MSDKTIVRGWVVQIKFPAGWISISREDRVLVRFSGYGTVFKSRQAARVEAQELRTTNKLSAERVRIRRATVTLEIKP